MKLRIRFTKTGKVRFTSHRDVARLWERAVRRVALPVAYSQGFTPRPRLSFGLALSTGYESQAEYLDVDLDPERSADVDPSALAEPLTRALPFGMDVSAIRVLEPGAESLQQVIDSCRFTIDVPGVDLATARAAVARLLEAETLPVTRERKGKMATDDIRPGIWHLAADAYGDGVLLDAELAARPRALRPSELLTALALPGPERLVCRTHQWILLDGHRHEPLPADIRWAASTSAASTSLPTEDAPPPPGRSAGPHEPGASTPSGDGDAPSRPEAEAAPPVERAAREERSDVRPRSERPPGPLGRAAADHPTVGAADGALAGSAG